MEKQNEIDAQFSPKKKPKWLRSLETQSWQAELIISGLAIFGSLQLPGLLNNLLDYFLFNFSEEYMGIFFFLFIYPYFAAAILIFSFIAHLVLRALWIGMLGLVSVFPNGINADQELFSKDYMQKFLRDYPDVNQFNKNLDNLCSSIFAASAAMAIVMVMISFTISVILIIATLINWIIPSFSILNVVITIGCIFFIISIFAGLFNSKKFREKDWVKKIHYPLAKVMGKAIYLFAMKPISYISMIFMTNSKNNSFFSLNALASTFSIVFATFLVFPLLTQSNLFYFRQDNFFSYRTNSFHLKSSKYENLLSENPTLLAPLIQSDIIDGKVIKLFIPWLHREQSFANELCGEYVSDDDLSLYDRKSAKTKHAVDCCKKYFEISLNDSILPDLKYYQHHHYINGTAGFLTYISTKDCKPLENILTIKSHYKNEEGEMRVTQIPFIFEGE